MGYDLLEQSTVDLRALAALSICASKEETRYYLNGVCVEIAPREAVYVATDGHRLCAHRRELGKDDTDNTLIGTFIIPTEACVAIKVKKDDPGTAFLSRDGIGLRLLQLGAERGHYFKPIDGVYPEWRLTCPRAVSGEPGHFNADYFASFNKISKKLIGVGGVLLSQNGEKEAAIVNFPAGDDTFGVLMSMRGDLKLRSFPQWATPLPEAVAAE